MAAKKSSPLKIIPLGGLDGIGKNMTVFECGDDMVLVDAGLMFPDDSQPGIDLVLPDHTYVLENEEKLRGIIVTHGHEDHTGSLPYLLQDLNNKVPIFSSKLTLGRASSLSSASARPSSARSRAAATLTWAAFRLTSSP